MRRVEPGTTLALIGMICWALAAFLPAPLRVIAATPPRKTIDQFWFGVHASPRLTEWFNQVARADDVVAVTMSELELLEQLTAGRKQVLFTSVADAAKAIPELAGRVDLIGYNIEHWPRTPEDEQADPVAAVQRLSSLAQQYGIKVALGPDRRFAEEYGAAMAPYVDKVSLQVQRGQHDLGQVLAFVKPMVAELRAANPSLEINIQLRTEGTADEILSILQALTQDIDGVSFIYNQGGVALLQDLISRMRGGVAAGQPTLVPTPEATSRPLTPGAGRVPWFGVRVTPDMVDWFNQTAGPDDVAAVSWREIGLLDQIVSGRRQVLFTSVAEAEANVLALVGRAEIIGYDLEHWPQTPEDEQADPVAAVQRLHVLGQAYGMAVAVGPDRRFAVDYGTAMAPFVDKFSLQLQRAQQDSEVLLGYALPLIAQLRAANPAIEINAQLRVEGDLDALKKLVDELRPYVDGFSIIFSPTDTAMAQEFIGSLKSQSPAIAVTASPAAAPSPSAATMLAPTLGVTASVVPDIQPPPLPVATPGRYLQGEDLLLAAAAVLGVLVVTGLLIVLFVRNRSKMRS